MAGTKIISVEVVTPELLEKDFVKEPAKKLKSNNTMHELTKEEAKYFIESQGYDVILSAKVENWSAEEEIVYFPESKEEFIKNISEELMVWTKEGELIGDFTDDWKETLDTIIDYSVEVENNFTAFCETMAILAE